VSPQLTWLADAWLAPKAINPATPSTKIAREIPLAVHLSGRSMSLLSP
jgi:hypothetical protein